MTDIITYIKKIGCNVDMKNNIGPYTGSYMNVNKPSALGKLLAPMTVAFKALQRLFSGACEVIH